MEIWDLKEEHHVDFKNKAVIQKHPIPFKNHFI